MIPIFIVVAHLSGKLLNVLKLLLQLLPQGR
jgi:hypothetical protein